MGIKSGTHRLQVQWVEEQH